MGEMKAKEERVKDFVQTIFGVLGETSEAAKLIVETLTHEERQKAEDRLENYLTKAFENYARSRPLQPNVETVLAYPDWIWHQKLYTKDPQTGVLSPVKLIPRKEDED